MRALLFLVALALAAAPALAQEGNATDPDATPGGAPAGEGNATGEPPAEEGPGSFTFTIVPINVGGDWRWALEGETRSNPPLVVTPGAQVTIIIKQTAESEGTPHNLQVTTPEKPTTPNIVGTGETETLTFTAPTTTGTLSYVCLIHAGSMKGVLTVRTESAAGGGGAAGEWEEFEGETVPLGSVAPGATPECADRPVPAVIADNVIGGPVASDYLQRCQDPNAGDVAEVPPHGADFVIPISWGLIALGIVGVVWVHKAYKP